MNWRMQEGDFISTRFRKGDTEGSNLDPKPRRSFLDVAYQEVQRQTSSSVSFLMLMKGVLPG